MATSPTHINGHTPLLRNEEEPPQSAPVFRPMGRRTPSFSSSSSSSWDSSFRSSSFSSLNEEFPPFSPSTPLTFKGVPFSWEQLPGIPKEQGSKKKDASGHHLPPPPAGTTTVSASASRKQHHQEEISPKKSNRFQRDDPFFAALVECSKEGGDEERDSSNFSNIIHKGRSSKITRTLSDRFGMMNMYTFSCKRTCTVSESIVSTKLTLPSQSKIELEPSTQFLQRNKYHQMQAIDKLR